MHLPQNNKLSTELLVSCFNSTSATYKFYWLLAIVEEVEHKTTKISKHRLFTKMVTNAWYTVNYFKLSFGKQDVIHKAVENIKDFEKLTIDEKRETLNTKIENSFDISTRKELNHFDKNVPHWFLSPWFNQSSKSEIYNRSQQFENNCLYALYKTEIIINPDWVTYIQTNAKLIKDFCYWNLAIFLQTRNPNVPDIPNKLIKPAVRNSLTEQRNKYWKNVFQQENYVKCIFTDTKLYYEENNYALDHFVPHAFVSHDLIWNLIPIDKSFNSSKSDKLPLIDIHFDKFYQLQKKAFEINRAINSKSKYMDEYLIIFPELADFSKQRFQNIIQPLITIAHNNGFSYLNEK